MAKENFEKMVENKEQFMAASQEVFPLMLKIRDIMKEHGFTDTTYITIGVDGYTELRPHGAGWTLHTYDFDQEPKAKFEYQEKITV